MKQNKDLSNNAKGLHKAAKTQRENLIALEETLDKPTDQHDVILENARATIEKSRWNISLVVIQIIFLVFPFYLNAFELLLCLVPVSFIISILTIAISRQNLREISYAQQVTGQRLLGIRLNRIYLIASIIVLIFCVIAALLVILGLYLIMNE